MAYYQYKFKEKESKYIRISSELGQSGSPIKENILKRTF